MYGQALSNGYRCHCDGLGLNKEGQREKEAGEVCSRFYQAQVGNTLEKAFMVSPLHCLPPVKTFAFHDEVSISMCHTEVSLSPFRFYEMEMWITSLLISSLLLPSFASVLLVLPS